MWKMLYPVKMIPIFILTCGIIPLQIGIIVIYLLLILPFCYLGAKSILTPSMRFIARLLFLVSGKFVHVYGKHNIRSDRNYLLISNHSSYFDVPGIVTFSPSLSWLGRDKFLKIPVFSTFLKFIQFIPVYPGNHEKSFQTINAAVAKADNLTIAIFPEGTRTSHGRMNTFKKGFVHIFRGADLDILPVTLNGFYTFMPRHRWIVNPFVRLEAIVHPPIPREQLLSLTNDEIVEIVRGTIASGYRDQGDWWFPSLRRIREQRRGRRSTKNLVKARIGKK
jgi:1-acyl-sn-glycerol-3-phosphate acyltransferase